MSLENQGELDFHSGGGGEGYSAWREQRREALQRLGWEMGLPFGHPVEVWLKGGIRLRGLLRLREDVLFMDAPRDLHLELRVEGVSFRLVEIESCVRLD